MKNLFALSAALLCLGPAIAQERGATRAGDVHVYAVQQKAERQQYDETVTVTAVEGDQIRTLHTRSTGADSRQGLYGTDWSSLVSGASGSRFEPAMKVLQLPLEAGRQWDQTVQVITANGARSQIKLQGQVVGREKVVTPAGEFDAWRVDSKGYISGVSWQGGFQIQQKFWYAPAIDRLVRVEYRESRTMGADNVAELKAFKAAP